MSMIYLLVLIILFSYSPMAFADLVDDRDLLLEQGIKFFGEQKYKDAIVSFDTILDFEPDNVDALFNKGKALVQLDNSDEGMSYVKKALEIEPDNVDVLTYLSVELVKSERLEEAKIYYEKILEIEPDNVDALHQGLDSTRRREVSHLGQSQRPCDQRPVDGRLRRARVGTAEPRAVYLDWQP